MKIRCMGCMEEYDSYYDVCPSCGMVKNSPPQDVSFLLPGTILHQRYMVGNGIHSSDFNITYIGYDLMELKKVSIKEYYPRECSSRVMGSNHINVFEDERKEDFQKGFHTFLKNGQLFAGLDIPGMVMILDTFLENGTAYLIQEFLEGESLEDYMVRENTLGMEQALEIIMPVLDVLSQLHERQIYHFRVNPGNIFLTNFGEVKLMDFGGYQFDAINHEKKISSIVMDKYIAPELKQVEAKKDGCADVYSVCAVLYRMITGQEPEEGLERIHQDQLLSPEQMGVRLSKTQNNVIMNGLAPNPQSRTKTVDELIQQFSSIREVERKEIPNSKKEKRTLYLKTALYVGLPCLVILMTIMGFLVYQSSRKEVKVADGFGQESTGVLIPNFKNADYETEAKKIAKEDGLELNIADRKNSDKIEKGKIISQSPEAGTVSQDGTVNVVVSAGTDTVIMNNVIGYNKIEQLKKEGFIIIKEQMESHLIPGYIISVKDTEGNNIESGKEIPEGCAIKIQTASENSEINTKKKEKVPDLIGMTYEKVLEKIEKYNFYVGLKTEGAYSREKVAKAGEICKMEIETVGAKKKEDISPGEKAVSGSYLYLTLSKGPKPVALPDYYKGKALDTVEKELKDRNLIYDSDKYDYIYSSQYSRGTVIKITTTCHHEDSLEGNLHWDDKVNLTLSKGPKPVPATTAVPKKDTVSGSRRTRNKTNNSDDSENNYEKKKKKGLQDGE